MQAAVHIGVLGGVGMLEAIEHRLRLLRRSCVVEIDERLAVNRHGEDRKILADAADVIGAVGDGFLHVSPFARRPEVPAEGGLRRRTAGELRPRRKPGDDLIHQRVAQAGVLDSLDRLADERLDEQRLGVLGRNAARLEIKQ